MNVTLQKVLEKDKIILRNLYSLYLHDLSTYTSTLDIGEDGFFEYEEIEMFWKIEGMSPYFIHLDEKIVGFILLLERPFLSKERDCGVNDIFILNKYKGKGIGRLALKKLFQEKQGKYFVVELAANTPAVSFLKKILHEFQLEYEERMEVIDGEKCYIQKFTV